jgi:predicted lipoprotein with Yx(FWY)xxD motif
MRRYFAIIAVAVLAVALALGATACEDDDEGDGEAEDTPAAEETEPGDGEESPEAEETEPSGDTTPEPGAFTTVVATDNPSLGTILTTFDGFTLYTFDNDEPGVSNCNEGCIESWPPMVSAGAPTAGEGVEGTVALIERNDGTQQVTFDNQPLYMYSADASAGDANGDGVGGVWHVVVLE